MYRASTRKSVPICDGFSVPTALHFYSVHLYTGEIGAGKYHRGISTRGAFIIKAMLQMLLVSYNYSTVPPLMQGLGKTVEVISFLSHLYQLGSSGHFLVVVPSSTLGTR